MATATAVIHVGGLHYASEKAVVERVLDSLTVLFIVLQSLYLSRYMTETGDKG